MISSLVSNERSSKLLDQLSFAAHAVEHLQQHGAHELFGGNARAAALDVDFVHSRELGIHLGQPVATTPILQRRAADQAISRMLVNCNV